MNQVKLPGQRRLLTGPSHFEIVRRYGDKIDLDKKIKDGFSFGQRKFLSREKAMKLAKKKGMLKSGAGQRPRLDSEELK